MRAISIVLLLLLTTMAFSQFAVELGPASQAIFTTSFASQIKHLEDTLFNITNLANFYEQSMKSIREIEDLPNKLKENILGYITDGKALANQIYNNAITGWHELEEIKDFYNNFLDYTADRIPSDVLSQRLADLQDMLNDVGKRAGRGVETVKSVFNSWESLKQSLEKLGYAAKAGSNIALLEVQGEILANVAAGINEMQTQLATQNENIALAIEQQLAEIKLHEEFTRTFEDIESFNPFDKEKNESMPQAWLDILPAVQEYSIQR